MGEKHQLNEELKERTPVISIEYFVTVSSKEIIFIPTIVST